MIARTLFICAIAVAAARTVNAGEPAHAAALSAAHMPKDVDVYLSFSGAAELRRTRAGLFVAHAAQFLLKDERVSQAWNAFASHLDMDAEHAFDALLGQQVTFVLRRQPQPMPVPWAITSVVDLKTARLIRKRLDPSPRGFRAGQPILSIEQGQFVLAIQRLDRGSAKLILAPAQETELFETLLAPPADTSTLASTARFRRLTALAPNPEAIMLFRSAVEPGGSLGLALSTAALDFDITFFIESGRLAAASAAVRPWPGQLATALDPNAYLSAVEWSVPNDPPITVFSYMRRVFPFLPQSIGPEGLIDARRILVIQPATDGVFAMTLALESTDFPSLATAGDEIVAGALAGLWPKPPVRDQLNLGGQYPDALRQIDLTERVVPIPGPIVAIRPTVAWRFASSTRSDAVHGAESGWWVIGSEPRLVNDLSDTLAAPRPNAQRAAPWIALGTARPAALVRAIKTLPFPLPDPLPAYLDFARHIDRVRWESLRADDGSVQGSVHLSLTREIP